MNVVITGASKGLGKAIAEKFAGGGHNLWLCSRNEHHLYKCLEELLTKYPEVTVKGRPFDLSVKEEAIAMGQWILQQEIQVDILVNNAGLFEPGSVHSEADGTLERTLAVNLFSAYHLTRTLIEKMKHQQSGHIFNMCSIASLKAYDNGGAYSISKFALAGFTKNLREEMKPYGIKVTGVYPGAAYTESWAGSGVDPKRIMEANDVAEMIYASAHLSSQACVEDIILRPQLGDL